MTRAEEIIYKAIREDKAVSFVLSKEEKRKDIPVNSTFLEKINGIEKTVKHAEIKQALEIEIEIIQGKSIVIAKIFGRKYPVKMKNLDFPLDYSYDENSKYLYGYMLPKLTVCEKNHVDPLEWIKRTNEIFKTFQFQ